MPIELQRRDFLEKLLSMPTLATVGQVTQTSCQNNGGWVIEGAGIARVFEPDPRGCLRLTSLKNADTGYEWALPGYCDFAYSAGDVHSEGLGPDSGFLLTGQEAKDFENGSTELRLDFEHRTLSLKLSLFYRSFPGVAVFEQRCRLENIGREIVPEVRRFDPVFFRIRGALAHLQVYSIRRDQYSLERLPIAEELEVRGGGWNIPEHAGFVALENSSAREILFLGIQWERDWIVRFRKRARDGLEVSAGLIHVTHDLMPGDVLESPRILTGVSHGDLDRACRVLHDYLSGYVFPPKLPDFPWVAYDIWGTEKEDVEEMILGEIEFAADLGIEHFYIDASWWEGSSKRGTGDWGCGVGRYREDREKFPRGLPYIADRVHEKGMKFGLWVDPVVVDQRLVPNEIPHKWVGQKDGRDNVLRIPGWEAPVVHICLGNPDVVDHLKTNLSRLVTNYKLDWLKWDNSGLPAQPTICNRDDHGHQSGDGSYAAQRGYYAVWEHLHENHPRLVLEQCSYGSRHDYGLAPYCRANWLSDASYPSRKVRENALAASYIYPSFYNSAWIVHSDPEIQEQKDPALLDTLFRSRMMGLFGFGTLHGKLLTERVSLYPREVLAAARRNIPVYKRYRHLLSEDCYHLTPPAGSAEAWQVVEFCKRDGSEAAVLAFRNGSTQAVYRIQFKGLRPNTSYRVRSENDNTETVSSGAKLIREGVVVELPKARMSELLMLHTQGSPGGFA